MIKDLVICNWCGVTSIVNFDVDDCPECRENGYLFDIKQGVE